jgi:predicted PurR-regulated permease PerM
MGATLLAAGVTNTSSDAVPVAVSVVATLVVVAVLAAVASLLRQARAVRRSAAVLVADSQRLLAAMEATIGAADAHLERVDELIGSAESISDAVSSASRLASAAVSGPVIKAMAFSAGAARARRRWQQGPVLPAPRPMPRR